VRRLLIVRPEPGGSASARRAQAMGLEPVAYPLFAIAPLPWTPPPAQDFDALLLTSANGAVQAGPDLARYQALPTYAVGARTATALDRFVSVVAGTGDGTAIARQIAQDGHRRVLHLAGADSIPLDAPDLSVTRIAVYAASESGDAEDLAARLEPGMILLTHSPRAARRLAALIPGPARADLHLVAISQAALAAAGTGWASGCSPPQPSDEAMLALAALLCE
jgi:uroporphyrinogen-III synthase